LTYSALFRAHARAGQLAGSDEDLDIRVEPLGARRPGTRPLRAAGGVDKAADRNHGGIEPALGETKQRQARLRFESVPAGLEIHLLGTRELTAQTMDFALLVAGAPRHAFAPARKMLTRTDCF